MNMDKVKLALEKTAEFLRVPHGENRNSWATHVLSTDYTAIGKLASEALAELNAMPAPSEGVVEAAKGALELLLRVRSGKLPDSVFVEGGVGSTFGYVVHRLVCALGPPFAPEKFAGWRVYHNKKYDHEGFYIYTPRDGYYFVKRDEDSSRVGEVEKSTNAENLVNDWNMPQIFGPEKTTIIEAAIAKNPEIAQGEGIAGAEKNRSSDRNPGVPSSSLAGIVLFRSRADIVFATGRNARLSESAYRWGSPARWNTCGASANTEKYRKDYPDENELSPVAAAAFWAEHPPTEEMAKALGEEKPAVTPDPRIAELEAELQISNTKASSFESGMNTKVDECEALKVERDKLRSDNEKMYEVNFRQAAKINEINGWRAQFANDIFGILGFEPTSQEAEETSIRDEIKKVVSGRDKLVERVKTLERAANVVIEWLHIGLRSGGDEKGAGGK